MSFGGSTKGFTDSKVFRQRVKAKAEVIMADLQDRLPDNYIGEDFSPNYALQIKSLAYESARFICILEELYADIGFEKTRGEFLSQIVAFYAFLDQRFAQTDSTDIKVRDFLLAVLKAYLTGSKKTTIEAAVKLATGLDVPITENYLVARENNDPDPVPSIFTFDIDISVSDTDEDITKLQELIELLIDLIKPAHTLFRTKFIFTDGSDPLTDQFKFLCIVAVDENGDPIIQDGFVVKIKNPLAQFSICDSENFKLLLNEHEDLRKECNKRETFFQSENITVQSAPRNPFVLDELPNDLHLYRVSKTPIVKENGELADTPTDVTVFVNSIVVDVANIYPLAGIVKLVNIPNPTDVVTIQYYYNTAEKISMELNDPLRTLNSISELGMGSPLDYTTLLLDPEQNFTYDIPKVCEFDYDGWFMPMSSLLNTPQNLVFNGKYLFALSLPQNFLLSNTSTITFDDLTFRFVEGVAAKPYEITIGASGAETLTNIENALDNLAITTETDYVLDVIDSGKLTHTDYVVVDGVKHFFTRSNFELEITNNIELFNDTKLFVGKDFIPFIPNNITITVQNNNLLTAASTLTVNNQVFNFAVIPTLGRITIGATNEATADNIFTFLSSLAIFEISHSFGTDLVVINNAVGSTNSVASLVIANFSSGAGISVGQNAAETIQNAKDFLDNFTDVESFILSDRLIIRNTLPIFIGSGATVTETTVSDKIQIGSSNEQTAKNIKTFLDTQSVPDTDYVENGISVYILNRATQSSNRSLIFYKTLKCKLDEFLNRKIVCGIDEETLITEISESKLLIKIRDDQRLSVETNTPDAFILEQQILSELRSKLNDFQHFESFGQEIGNHVTPVQSPRPPLFAETYSIDSPYYLAPDEQFQLNCSGSKLNQESQLFENERHQNRDPYPHFYKNIEVTEFCNAGVEGLISPICETSISFEFGSIIPELDASGNPTGGFISIGALKDEYDGLEDDPEVLSLPDICSANSWLQNQHLMAPLTSFDGVYPGLGPGSGHLLDPAQIRYTDGNGNCLIANQNCTYAIFELVDFIEELPFPPVVDEISEFNIDMFEEEHKHFFDCMLLADFDESGNHTNPENIIVDPQPTIDPEDIPDSTLCLFHFLEEEECFINYSDTLIDQFDDFEDFISSGVAFLLEDVYDGIIDEGIVSLNDARTFVEIFDDFEEAIILEANLVLPENFDDFAESITELSHSIIEAETLDDFNDQISALAQNLYFNESFACPFILNADNVTASVEEFTDLPDPALHESEIWCVNPDVLTTVYYRSNGFVWELTTSKTINQGTLNDPTGSLLTNKPCPLSDRVTEVIHETLVTEVFDSFEDETVTFTIF